MQPDQPLAEIAARCLSGVASVLDSRRPELLLVQGDTTTALAAALAGFYARVPVAHVEAGLRSGKIDEPFPEELNRRVIDSLSRWLFAPTRGAAERLEQEGVEPERVFVTGNTVVDALEHVKSRFAAPRAAAGEPQAGPLVLVTCHRRESFGPALRQICRAVVRLAAAHPGHRFVWPLHLNPNVKDPIRALVGGSPNVELIEPLPYDRFLALLSRATLVLTDSGGVQEEAPSFGVPALVLRERLDRPESVELGWGVQCGVAEERIVLEATRLLGAPLAARDGGNPYGDGHAGQRIADLLERELAKQNPDPEAG
jgi:UDP-N-acetylglucosamine 2-epimerase (non-hydrolysing)